MDPRLQLFNANNNYGGAAVVVPPPVITSSDTFNAAENQTAVGTVTATGTAPITFSITGGADAAFFAIDSGSGVLTFLAAPDFETPLDAGANNVYNLTVTATNAGGATNQNVAVTVTNVAEPPIVSPAAWWRFNSGVTITGSGVSQWDDASGNGHHFTQGTDGNRPTHSAGIIDFVSADSLVTGAWALAQPFTFYALVQADTHAENNCLANFNEAAARLILRQAGTTPRIYMSVTAGNIGPNSDLTLGSFHALGVVVNGASSVIHVNGAAAVTGLNFEAHALSALRLGSQIAAALGWDGKVKEALLYAAAHDGTQRQTVFDYLAGL